MKIKRANPIMSFAVTVTEDDGTTGMYFRHSPPAGKPGCWMMRLDKDTTVVLPSDKALKLEEMFLEWAKTEADRRQAEAGEPGPGLQVVEVNSIEELQEVVGAIIEAHGKGEKTIH